MHDDEPNLSEVCRKSWMNVRAIKRNRSILVGGRSSTFTPANKSFFRRKKKENLLCLHQRRAEGSRELLGMLITFFHLNKFLLTKA